MSFFVVLKSEIDSTSYIGYTSTLEKRLVEHNRQNLSIRSKRPWKLVYQEEYQTPSEIIKIQKGET